MILGKLCEFYESSKCILKGKYCDLNCNRLFNEEESDSYEKSELQTKWQMKEKNNVIERSGWRLK